MGKELRSSSPSRLGICTKIPVFQKAVLCGACWAASRLPAPTRHRLAGAETQPVICPAGPPLPPAFSGLLSSRYGLTSRIQGVMQTPKGTAWNSGSDTEQKTRKSAIAIRSLPHLKRLLLFGSGSREHQFCEAILWPPKHTNTHTPHCAPVLGFHLRLTPALQSPYLWLRDTGVELEALWRHLKSQRLPRWTECIIFWLVGDRDPNLDLLQTVLYSLYLLFDIFGGEELTWVKRITAGLCGVMNHHRAGQRCSEGNSSRNTKWLFALCLITTDHSLARGYVSGSVPRCRQQVTEGGQESCTSPGRLGTSVGVNWAVLFNLCELCFWLTLWRYESLQVYAIKLASLRVQKDSSWITGEVLNVWSILSVLGQ